MLDGYGTWAHMPFNILQRKNLVNIDVDLLISSQEILRSNWLTTSLGYERLAMDIVRSVIRLWTMGDQTKWSGDTNKNGIFLQRLTSFY